MFNNNLQAVIKNALIRNLDIRPLLVSGQHLAEVELAKEVPDLKELMQVTAKLSAAIMKDSIFMEKALSEVGSEEELMLVADVLGGKVDRSEHVGPEIIELIEENERFGKELSKPLVDIYGDRANTIIMEKIVEQGLIMEFSDLVAKAIEEAAPTNGDLLSLSRIWTKDNVEVAAPGMSKAFNEAWDLAAAQDQTKH